MNAPIPPTRRTIGVPSADSGTSRPMSRNRTKARQPTAMIDTTYTDAARKAAQPTSEHAGDGQQLAGVRMIATMRCAPPDNKPTVVERDTCSPWLLAEWRSVLPTVRVVVA